MSSTTILSDNGVSSGSAGLKSSAGNDGVLILQTTTAGGAATNAVYVDTSQNVGVGTSSPGSGIRLDVQAAKGVVRLTSTTGTNEVYYQAANTGGGLYFGRDASVGGAFYSGSPAYGAIFLSTGAYPMTFAVNSVEAARFDASGNLMVGGTTQYGAAKLTLTASGAYMSLNSTTGGYSLVRGFDNGTERWSIGQIGFGGVDGMAFYTGSSNTERARIDSSGNLLVGTTSVPSGGQKMNIAGGITPTTDNAYIFGNSGLRWQALYAANGTIQTSDERAKTDIVDSPLGLAFINSLRPVAYKFKVGKNEVLEDGSVVPVAGVRQHFGLLAQDVKQSIGNVDFGGWILTDPENQESDQGLRYDEFISPLIKAIQEQQAIIQTLTQRVEALEGAKA